MRGKAPQSTSTKPQAGSSVGVDEVLIGVGLLLVTVGLWAAWGTAALVVPGAVLIWIALPTRAAFVVKPPASDAPEGEQH